MRHTTIRFALLLSLAACGPAAPPEPEAIIRAWADAAQAGDYTTAEQYMAGDGFAKMTWREPHTRYHGAGHRTTPSRLRSSEHCRRWRSR